jgi:transposase-like protein
MNNTQANQAKVDQLLDELLQNYQSPEEVLGKDGLLKQLTQRLLEKALQAELTHHLQQPCQEELPSAEQRPRRNSRNGYSQKTLQTHHGALNLSIPRDRWSEFEPVIVPKGQRRLAGLDEKILAL